tara:strand:+ start:146 stop:424 length:279 start_codon:yes stop_codon:yes gene_type:complete
VKGAISAVILLAQLLFQVLDVGLILVVTNMTPACWIRESASRITCGIFFVEHMLNKGDLRKHSSNLIPHKKRSKTARDMIFIGILNQAKAVD